jgi:UPF0755 protein
MAARKRRRRASDRPSASTVSDPPSAPRTPTAESDAAGGFPSVPPPPSRKVSKGRARGGKRAGHGGGKHDEPKRRLHPLAQAVLWAVGLVVFVVAGYIYLVYPARSGPGQGREVDLVLPAAESADALAERLTAAGLIDSPRLFSLYVRTMGVAQHDTSVAAGPHLVTDDLSPSELLARLTRRPGRTRAHVTFPEGWTRFDMARRLQNSRICAAAPFLAATRDPALLAELHLSTESAEGFLFPATYDLLTDSDPADIVRRLKAEFDKRWTEALAGHESGLADLKATLGWDQAQVVTLASIIEKEAGAPEERTLIASVFLNRLRDPSFKKKVLQSDPTAGYGCLVDAATIPACAGYTGRITHDINMAPENRWSTYTHEQLPPGPIANPGARSIEAVLAPAATHYFYFFARGGKTQFTETYEAHNAVVHGK